MEPAFSLGVYSRHATGRGGRLRPPPRRCPPENSGGEGRSARAARTVGGGDGALPAAWAVAGTEPPPGAGCPPPSGGGSSPPSAPPVAPRPPGHPPAISPGGAAGLGWALAPCGCLKRSGEQGKCRLTAEKTRGLADFVCKNNDGCSNNSSKSCVRWVFKESPRGKWETA